MANNINDMQVFNIFKPCMDTTGPFITPFVTCLQDMHMESLMFAHISIHTILFAMVLVELPQNKQ